VAKLLVDAGFIVFAAFISTFEEDRTRVRTMFEPGDFIEVYLKCDLTVCEQRDTKGLYRMARGVFCLSLLE
jgi:adenylylsulfate kinase